MKTLVLCLILLLSSCKKEDPVENPEPVSSIPKNPLGDNPEKHAEDMINALEKKEYEKVKSILYQNVSDEEAQSQINHLVGKYGQHNMLLWMAAPFGDLETSKKAIEAGANVNIEIEGKGTPLLGATQAGNIVLVEYLLKKDADPNLRGISGNTPLSIAVSNDRKDLVDLLIKYKAGFVRGGDQLNKEYSILTVPITTNNLPMVKYLIDKGVNPNGGGGLPLAFAIMTKNKEAINLLIKNGADVNYSGKNGFRPLMTAVVEGEKNIIELLINLGADHKIKDSHGKDVFDWAKQYKSKGGEVLRKILAKRSKK